MFKIKSTTPSKPVKKPQESFDDLDDITSSYTSSSQSGKSTAPKQGMSIHINPTHGQVDGM